MPTHWWQRTLSAFNLVLFCLVVAATATALSLSRALLPRCDSLLPVAILVPLVALLCHLPVTVYLLRHWPPVPFGCTARHAANPLLEADAKSAAAGGGGAQSEGLRDPLLVAAADDGMDLDLDGSGVYAVGDTGDDNLARGGTSCAQRCSARCTPRFALLAAFGVLCATSVSLTLAAGGIAAWILRSTSVVRSGPLRLPGLHGPVRVEREANGVPHILASDLHDAAFAQGVVHAQERAWQMEFQRRVGQGRLSEVVGRAALDTDKLMRTLGVYAAAQAAYDRLAEGTRGKIAVDGYAAGVNAYLQAGAPRPLEFLLFGVHPEPWLPADSLVWAKLMSYDLSGNLDRELSRYRLLALHNLSSARVNQLIPPFDARKFPTVLSAADVDVESVTAALRSAAIPEALWLPAGDGSLLTGGPPLPLLELTARFLSERRGLAAEGAASRTGPPPLYTDGLAAAAGPAASLPTRLVRGVYDVVASPAAPFRALARSLVSRALSWRSDMSGLLRGPGGLRTEWAAAGASNNWVVDGTHSATGLPLLCNDPHLSLMAPSIWFLVHLSAPGEGLSARGAGFVGLPGVVLGANDRIAWGVTNTGADVQDSYVLRVNPANASEYAYDAGYRPFTYREERIRIAGDSDYVMTVRSSHHGPVISDNDVASWGELPGPLALRWVSTDPTVPDSTIESFVGMNFASNWSDFRAALAQYVAPSQNFVFADAAGNIGYQMPGLIPIRNASAGHTGAWPAPGWLSDYEWQAWVPFDALPKTVNPPEGFIVSANNQVPPPGYPLFISADWDEGSDGYRAMRIRDLIARSRALTLDDMAAVQGDTRSLFAVDVAALVMSLPPSALATEGGRALRILLGDANSTGWFDDAKVGSAAATLWAAVYQELTTLAAPETGATHWKDAMFILGALGSDASTNASDPACLAQGFPSCSAFLAGVLERVATEYGVSSGGGTGSAPGWGENGVHTATFEHQVLGGSPLSCVADRSVGHGGDDYTIDVGTMSLAAGAKFAQAAGPSYRQIIDLAATDASRFMHGPGQSGNLVDAESVDWYDSFVSLWGGVQYLLIPRSGYDSRMAQTLQL